MSLNISEWSAGVSSTFGSFLEWINNSIQSIVDRINSSEGNIVFGSYSGDNSEERIINLGFTPSLVEIFPQNGSTSYFSETWSCYRGGMAAQGAECITPAGKLIEIVDGGFKVMQKAIRSGYETYSNEANALGTVYYYKVYKECPEITITT